MAPLRSIVLALFILSAIPLAIIISLEFSAASPGSRVYRYHSNGWMRESIAWDDHNRRFLISLMEGGVGQVNVPEDQDADGESQVLEEVVVVKDADLAGNATTGIYIDRPNNRLLVAYTDLLWGRYSALAAYDLTSWKRLFLTHLSVSDNEQTLGDDIAIDTKGDIYMTDAKACRIWHFTGEGKLLPSITTPLFNPNKWYENLIGLNGIVYNRAGNFLLAVHSIKGQLFKIDLNKDLSNEEAVTVVELVGAGSSVMLGDGMKMISATKLVVASARPSARLLESQDGWETAAVVGKFYGMVHRIASSATVKDGKVFLNHIFGLGFPKKHVIMEAVFSP